MYKRIYIYVIFCHKLFETKRLAYYVIKIYFAG